MAKLVLLILGVFFNSTLFKKKKESTNVLTNFFLPSFTFPRSDNNFENDFRSIKFWVELGDNVEYEEFEHLLLQPRIIPADIAIVNLVKTAKITKEACLICFAKFK